MKLFVKNVLFFVAVSLICSTSFAQFSELSPQEAQARWNETLVRYKALKSALDPMLIDGFVLYYKAIQPEDFASVRELISAGDGDNLKSEASLTDGHFLKALVISFEAIGFTSDEIKNFAHSIDVNNGGTSKKHTPHERNKLDAKIDAILLDLHLPKIHANSQNAPTTEKKVYTNQELQDFVHEIETNAKKFPTWKKLLRALGITQKDLFKAARTDNATTTKITKIRNFLNVGLDTHLASDVVKKGKVSVLYLSFNHNFEGAIEAYNKKHATKEVPDPFRAIVEACVSEEVRIYGAKGSTSGGRHFEDLIATKNKLLLVYLRSKNFDKFRKALANIVMSNQPLPEKINGELLERVMYLSLIENDYRFLKELMDVGVKNPNGHIINPNQRNAQRKTQSGLASVFGDPKASDIMASNPNTDRNLQSPPVGKDFYYTDLYAAIASHESLEREISDIARGIEIYRMAGVAKLMEVFERNVKNNGHKKILIGLMNDPKVDRDAKLRGLTSDDVSTAVQLAEKNKINGNGERIKMLKYGRAENQVTELPQPSEAPTKTKPSFAENVRKSFLDRWNKLWGRTAPVVVQKTAPQPAVQAVRTVDEKTRKNRQFIIDARAGDADALRRGLADSDILAPTILSALQQAIAANKTKVLAILANAIPKDDIYNELGKLIERFDGRGRSGSLESIQILSTYLSVVDLKRLIASHQLMHRDVRIFLAKLYKDGPQNQQFILDAKGGDEQAVSDAIASAEFAITERSKFLALQEAIAAEKVKIVGILANSADLEDIYAALKPMVRSFDDKSNASKLQIIQILASYLSEPYLTQILAQKENIHTDVVSVLNHVIDEEKAGHNVVAENKEILNPDVHKNLMVDHLEEKKTQVVEQTSTGETGDSKELNSVDPSTIVNEPTAVVGPVNIDIINPDAAVAEIFRNTPITAGDGYIQHDVNKIKKEAVRYETIDPILSEMNLTQTLTEKELTFLREYIHLTGSMYESVTNLNNSYLHYACKNGFHPKIIRMLVDHGFSINEQNSEGLSSFALWIQSFEKAYSEHPDRLQAFYETLEYLNDQHKIDFTRKKDRKPFPTTGPDELFFAEYIKTDQKILSKVLQIFGLRKVGHTSPLIAAIQESAKQKTPLDYANKILPLVKKGSNVFEAYVDPNGIESRITQLEKMLNLFQVAIRDGQISPDQEINQRNLFADVIIEAFAHRPYPEWNDRRGNEIRRIIELQIGSNGTGESEFSKLAEIVYHYIKINPTMFVSDSGMLDALVGFSKQMSRAQVHDLIMKIENLSSEAERKMIYNHASESTQGSTFAISAMQVGVDLDDLHTMQKSGADFSAENGIDYLTKNASNYNDKSNLRSTLRFLINDLQQTPNTRIVGEYLKALCLKLHGIGFEIEEIRELVDRIVDRQSGGQTKTGPMSSTRRQVEDALKNVSNTMFSKLTSARSALDLVEVSKKYSDAELKEFVEKIRNNDAKSKVWDVILKQLGIESTADFSELEKDPLAKEFYRLALYVHKHEIRGSDAKKALVMAFYKELLTKFEKRIISVKELHEAIDMASSDKFKIYIFGEDPNSAMVAESKPTGSDGSKISSNEKLIDLAIHGSSNEEFEEFSNILKARTFKKTTLQKVFSRLMTSMSDPTKLPYLESLVASTWTLGWFDTIFLQNVGRLMEQQNFKEIFSIVAAHLLPETIKNVELVLQAQQSNVKIVKASLGDPEITEETQTLIMRRAIAHGDIAIMDLFEGRFDVNGEVERIFHETLVQTALADRPLIYSRQYLENKYNILRHLASRMNPDVIRTFLGEGWSENVDRVLNEAIAIAQGRNSNAKMYAAPIAKNNWIDWLHDKFIQPSKTAKAANEVKKEEKKKASFVYDANLDPDRVSAVHQEMLSKVDAYTEQEVSSFVRGINGKKIEQYIKGLRGQLSSLSAAEATNAFVRLYKMVIFLTDHAADDSERKYRAAAFFEELERSFKPKSRPFIRVSLNSIISPQAAELSNEGMRTVRERATWMDISFLKAVIALDMDNVHRLKTKASPEAIQLAFQMLMPSSWVTVQKMIGAGDPSLKKNFERIRRKTFLPTYEFRWNGIDRWYLLCDELLSDSRVNAAVVKTVFASDAIFLLPDFILDDLVEYLGSDGKKMESLALERMKQLKSLNDRPVSAKVESLQGLWNLIGENQIRYNRFWRAYFEDKMKTIDQALSSPEIVDLLQLKQIEILKEIYLNLKKEVVALIAQKNELYYSDTKRPTNGEVRKFIIDIQSHFEKNRVWNPIMAALRAGRSIAQAQNDPRITEFKQRSQFTHANENVEGRDKATKRKKLLVESHYRWTLTTFDTERIIYDAEHGEGKFAELLTQMGDPLIRILGDNKKSKKVIKYNPKLTFSEMLDLKPDTDKPSSTESRVQDEKNKNEVAVVLDDKPSDNKSQSRPDSELVKQFNDHLKNSNQGYLIVPAQVDRTMIYQDLAANPLYKNEMIVFVVRTDDEVTALKTALGNSKIHIVATYVQFLTQVEAKFFADVKSMLVVLDQAHLINNEADLTRLRLGLSALPRAKKLALGTSDAKLNSLGIYKIGKDDIDLASWVEKHGLLSDLKLINFSVRGADVPAIHQSVDDLKVGLRTGDINQLSKTFDDVGMERILFKMYGDLLPFTHAGQAVIYSGNVGHALLLKQFFNSKGTLTQSLTPPLNDGDKKTKEQNQKKIAEFEGNSGIKVLIVPAGMNPTIKAQNVGLVISEFPTTLWSELLKRAYTAMMHMDGKLPIFVELDYSRREGKIQKRLARLYSRFQFLNSKTNVDIYAAVDKWLHETLKENAGYFDASEEHVTVRAGTDMIKDLSPGRPRTREKNIASKEETASDDENKINKNEENETKQDEFKSDKGKDKDIAYLDRTKLGGPEDPNAAKNKPWMNPDPSLYESTANGSQHLAPDVDDLVNQIRKGVEEHPYSAKEITSFFGEIMMSPEKKNLWNKMVESLTAANIESSWLDILTFQHNNPALESANYKNLHDKQFMLDRFYQYALFVRNQRYNPKSSQLLWNTALKKILVADFEPNKYFDKRFKKVASAGMLNVDRSSLANKTRSSKNLYSTIVVPIPEGKDGQPVVFNQISAWLRDLYEKYANRVSRSNGRATYDPSSGNGVAVAMPSDKYFENWLKEFLKNVKEKTQQVAQYLKNLGDEGSREVAALSVTENKGQSNQATKYGDLNAQKKYPTLIRGSAGISTTVITPQPDNKPEYEDDKPKSKTLSTDGLTCIEIKKKLAAVVGRNAINPRDIKDVDRDIAPLLGIPTEVINAALAAEGFDKFWLLGLVENEYNLAREVEKFIEANPGKEVVIAWGRVWTPELMKAKLNEYNVQMAVLKSNDRRIDGAADWDHHSETAMLPQRPQAKKVLGYDLGSDKSDLNLFDDIRSFDELLVAVSTHQRLFARSRSSKFFWKTFGQQNWNRVRMLSKLKIPNLDTVRRKLLPKNSGLKMYDVVNRIEELIAERNLTEKVADKFNQVVAERKKIADARSDIKKPAQKVVDDKTHGDKIAGGNENAKSRYDQETSDQEEQFKSKRAPQKKEFRRADGLNVNQKMPWEQNGKDIGEKAVGDDHKPAISSPLKYGATVSSKSSKVNNPINQTLTSNGGLIKTNTNESNKSGKGKITVAKHEVKTQGSATKVMIEKIYTSVVGKGQAMTDDVVRGLVQQLSTIEQITSQEVIQLAKISRGQQVTPSQAYQVAKGVLHGISLLVEQATHAEDPQVLAKMKELLQLMPEGYVYATTGPTDPRFKGYRLTNGKISIESSQIAKVMEGQASEATESINKQIVEWTTPSSVKLQERVLKAKQAQERSIEKSKEKEIRSKTKR